MTIEMTRLDAYDELRAVVGPLPCAARPHSGLVHRDGPCRCFVGGPAPEHAASPADASRVPAPRGASHDVVADMVADVAHDPAPDVA